MLQICKKFEKKCEDTCEKECKEIPKTVIKKECKMETFSEMPEPCNTIHDEYDYNCEPVKKMKEVCCGVTRNTKST